MPATGCCFCGAAIEDRDNLGPDIRTIVVSWGEGVNLEWWAHEQCFRDALHPDYRPPPDPLDMISAIEAFKADEAERNEEK